MDLAASQEYTCTVNSVEPIYSDTYRKSALHLVGPVIAGSLVVLGILTPDPVPFLLGIAYGLYVYFTVHTRYDIFKDRLVVHYGRPRRKILQLEDVKEIRLAKLPIGGEALLLQRKKGRAELLRPADPGIFLTQLEEAMNRIGR